MRIFQGRVVTPGTVTAEALVSHGGLNTLASFQKPLQFGDETAKCGDHNNPDLYGKEMRKESNAKYDEYRKMVEDFRKKYDIVVKENDGDGKKAGNAKEK